MPGVAVTDHASISGVPAFFRAAVEACGHCGNTKASHANGGKGACLIKGETCPGYTPSKLRPVAGCEFNVVDGVADGRRLVHDGAVLRADPKVKDNDHRGYSHLCVLARDRDGWKRLLRAVSESNDPAHFYYRPRLDVERLGELAGGKWVAFSGHPGSALANACFLDPKAAYRAKTVADARMLLKDRDALRKDLLALAGHFRDLFGRDNFHVEVQKHDEAFMPAAAVIAQCMRRVCDLTGIPGLATGDAHYPAPEDADDQRILLCGALKTSLRRVRGRADAGEDVTLGGFFRSDRYGVPDQAEMARLHGDRPEELANSLKIIEMCEAYELKAPPRLPEFPCPDGLGPDDYLARLCADGWRKKVDGVVPAERHAEYRARLDMELGVFREVGLSTYFLVVWDLVRYSTETLKCPVSEGRGSAAGCLVSHLLDVTDSDPVKGKLYFERFYNTGRNSPGNTQYPDIDLDFPVLKRDQLVEWLRDRWGRDRVGQVATFGTLHGREALTQVLKAHGWGTHDDQKAITKRFPPKDAVSDKLQEMMEETGEASLIRWSVEHNPDRFSEWATLSEDGEWGGPLGPLFAQACRIEGCKRTQGKHPSGVVVAPEPLADLCPLMFDKSTGQPIVGLEFTEAEKMGLLKLDVLGTLSQDRLSAAFDSIETGVITEEDVD